MHMRKILFLSVMLTLLAAQSWAQRAVSGKIIDDKKNPLPNVSVLVKGTNVGTVSREDGSYSLSVPANARTLVFSFTDMAEQEVNINNETVVNVTMSTLVRSMDEVVVVGYGTLK